MIVRYNYNNLIFDWRKVAVTIESYYEEMSKIDWVSKYYKVILPICFFGGIVLIAWNCIFAQLWNSPLLIVHSVLLALCMPAWASFKSFDRTAFVFNIVFLSFQIVNTVAIMIIEIISIIAIISASAIASSALSSIPLLGSVGAIASGIGAAIMLCFIIFRAVQLFFFLYPFTMMIKDRRIFVGPENVDK